MRRSTPPQLVQPFVNLRLGAALPGELRAARSKPRSSWKARRDLRRRGAGLGAIPDARRRRPVRRERPHRGLRVRLGPRARGSGSSAISCYRRGIRPSAERSGPASRPATEVASSSKPDGTTASEDPGRRDRFAGGHHTAETYAVLQRAARSPGLGDQGSIRSHGPTRNRLAAQAVRHSSVQRLVHDRRQRRARLGLRLVWHADKPGPSAIVHFTDEPAAGSRLRSTRSSSSS